jgi:hypothetical protein
MSFLLSPSPVVEAAVEFPAHRVQGSSTVDSFRGTAASKAQTSNEKHVVAFVCLLYNSESLCAEFNKGVRPSASNINDCTDTICTIHFFEGLTGYLLNKTKAENCEDKFYACGTLTQFLAAALSKMR